jgi:hypothetical protein
MTGGQKSVPPSVYALAAIVLASAIRFVAPLDGAQALGPQALEITTDAAGVDRVEFYVDGTLAGVARKAPWRVAHDFGTSLAAHTIVARILSNGFRTTEQASIVTAALTASESVTVDLVEVPLRIRAARKVTAADLTVRENGIEQSIREVAPQRGAAQFVFVIDRSLSMTGGKLDAALRAVDAESRLLRPDDTVSVVLFNHNVAKARPVARGEQLARLFGDLTPSGGTSLRDALASIPRAKRTYAIVITDGGDRNSALPEEEALRRISGTKTIVDAILLGDRDAAFLTRAAKNTGGITADATRDSLQRALHNLLVDINSRYVLAYQSRATGRGWRAIEIGGRRGVEVSNARKGYFAE